MRRPVGSRIALLASCAAGLLAAAPAHGEAPSIQQTGADEFPARSYTLRIPERLALEAGEVSVSENGQPVPGVTVRSAAANGESFATVLALDASNSMRGQAIERATQAARAFAARRAPEQRLGVVAFNDEATVLLPLTADEAEIAAALDEPPTLARSTHLHDAVWTGIGMLREADVGAGSVVVLSDGADTGSDVSLSELAAEAEVAGVRVFAIGLRSNRFDPATLEELAIGGTFADARDPGELRPVFREFSEQLASEYLIEYESPITAREGVTVEVRVVGVPGVARDRYTTSGGAASRSGQGFWASDGALVGALALVAGLMGLALFVALRPRRESVAERLAAFLGAAGAPSEPPTSKAAPSRLRASFEPIERAVERRRWWAEFNEQLDVARITVPPSRIIAAVAVGTILAALFIGEVLGRPLLVPLALMVPFAARARINRLLRAQRREFADQLADNLQLVASALRAGQSMAGAINVVVEEAPDPIRGEFRRIVNDERLGVPLEDAIRSVARRMDNRDLEQVALVATIQRETGGNTAEILDQVIETIRERDKLRRLMETLTAQGRLTQVIVSALPLVLLALVALLNPDYVEPMFETGSGRIALAIGAVLSIVGSLIIKRIVEIRV